MRCVNLQGTPFVTIEVILGKKTPDIAVLKLM